MWFLVFSFSGALLCSMLIVHSKKMHGVLTSDHPSSGPQKIHLSNVPRIGGLAIFIGVLVAVGAVIDNEFDARRTFWALILCSLPAFCAGFLEDLTKEIGATIRLLATVCSAYLAGVYLGAWLLKLQVLGLDELLRFHPAIAMAVTCFAVAGLSHSFNIIDGLNGLAGVVASIAFSGLAYVAFKLGDHQITILCLSMLGATLGFLVFNFPRGLLFLGDGGAYLLGFWVSTLSVLITARHPEVSKWFPLLLCAYPVTETMYTIYRRFFSRNRKIGRPDALHLHQLIFRRIIRWRVGSGYQSDRLVRNSLSSPFLWLLTLLGALPAVLFWDSVWFLRGFFVLFVLSYIFIYRAIVRFKVPAVLRVYK
jgi:UDP-GlcNAc:undecaprenyl-phosphate GlcNAc-1-phosphate transferase